MLYECVEIHVVITGCGLSILSLFSAHLYVARRVHIAKCFVCNESFESHTLLLLHQQDAHDSLELTRTTPSQTVDITCGKCKGNFALRSQYEAHRRRYPNDTRFPCADAFPNCEKTFATRCEQTTHRAAHKKQCRYCGKVFKNVGDLKRHVRTHTGERPFSRGVCGKSFSQRQTMRSHELTHTNIFPHACDVCDRRFHSKSEKNSHALVHTTERPYACDHPGCRYRGKSQIALMGHQKIHVMKKRHSICDRCGRVFVSESSLQYHRVATNWRTRCSGPLVPARGNNDDVNTNEHEASDDTSLAGAQHGQSALELDIGRVNASGTYTCGKCGMTFHSRRYLLRHQLAKDARSRCKGATTEPENIDADNDGNTEHALVGAVRGHVHFKTDVVHIDGKEMFACGHCGKACRTRCNVLRHQVAMHERFLSEMSENTEPHNGGDLDLACDACGKKFATSLALERHKAATSRRYRCLGRPIAAVDCSASFVTCAGCGKIFSTLAFLKMHQRRRGPNSFCRKEQFN